MPRSKPISPSADLASTQRAFTAALDGLIAQVKQDRSVLAAVLCGSLSHDTVWSKSDIDLLLVTIDDRKVTGSDLALNADGINVHVMLVPRAEFRKMVDGSLRNSFTHSFLTKGRLLYATDPSIETLCASLADLGRRDMQVQLLRAACFGLPSIYKAHKWFLTRGDLEYTAVWLLHAATALAQMEVISRGLLVDREVLPQAARLNPTFFRTVYSDLLNQPKTKDRVAGALTAVDEFMAQHTQAAFAPVLDHLREVGEVRGCREIEDHFQRNFGITGVITVCEYLADQGLLGKAATPVRLTKKSNVEVQELAFYTLTT